MGYRKIKGSAFSAMRPGDLIGQGDRARRLCAGRTSLKASGRHGRAESPYLGRIYAMQGGFDVRLSPFNRATQPNASRGRRSALRLCDGTDNGMTPATLIVDGPFCVYQGARFGNKCFRNFGGASGSGEHTMRWGLEQSRNLMTVRTASQIGMEPIVETIKTMGIDARILTCRPRSAPGRRRSKRWSTLMLANHGLRGLASRLDRSCP